jgi:dienelactone hydrolase
MHYLLVLLLALPFQPMTYDLRRLTVMPGWIDMHVHLTSGFGKDGKFTTEMAPEESAMLTASNAWLTLQAGFTTIQTMSAAVAVRDAIAKGRLPGPRILTIVQDLCGEGGKSGMPEQLREYVRKQKEAGADLLKIYASGGMTRGTKTLSQERLDAVCGEANKVGLRTHVHAYRDAVAAATRAGCRQIEHGYGAQADIIALDGDPLREITAVRRVVFVMKGGIVYKHSMPQQQNRSGDAFEAEKEISFPAEDGGIVSADLYGNGNRGVVLVHGGRFAKQSWQPQARELVKAGFRVLAIDLRGRGKSRGGPAAKPDDDGYRWDVLAAVRYLHQHDVKTVSIVGASMGGGAAAEASIEARPGEIDRIVLLAHSPIEHPEKIKGRTLFILTRNDANAAGPRLPKIREQYAKAPQPKKLVLLEGDAHAQFVFETEQGPRLLREILQFLSSQ